MSQPFFSIILPAYNEAKYLPNTLESVERAIKALGEPVEVIVVDNLSTDGTAAVAHEHGAHVVSVETRCIAAVRNGGAAQAKGRFLVFIDGDDHMAENMLVEIRKVMESGNFVGGGVASVCYDRSSMGIALTTGIVNFSLRLVGLSMFVFYTTPEAYEAINGFDETMLTTEDIDFARRLKRWGRKKGLKYKQLRSATLTKSARKFDVYGDWMLLWHPWFFLKACLRTRVLHEFWYKQPR